MANTIHLQVASPERQVYEGEVRTVQVPAADGYLGVLPGHAPLIAELGAGVMTFVDSTGKTLYLMVYQGLLEVLPDRVRVLTSQALWASEVDIERAKVQLDRATDLFHEHDYEADVEEALAAAERAKARIEAYNAWKNA